MFLLYFYKKLPQFINYCRNFLIKNSHLRELGIIVMILLRKNGILLSLNKISIILKNIKLLENRKLKIKNAISLGNRWIKK